MQNRTINQEVNVTAVYFQNGPEMATLPRRMEWQGQIYTFRGGLQRLVGKGKEVIRIFEMNDGEQRYRLMSNAQQSSWTLVNICPSV